MRARDNPLRTERILKMRYRPQGITWSELLDRCEALRYRAALVGPFGSGKTTLLEDLEQRFSERGFGTRQIRLDVEHPEFRPGFMRSLTAELTPRDILLFDGAEQMSPLKWLWFKWRTRSAGGVLITVHQSGRLPTLWECHTSPALLAEIAADLLDESPGRLLQTAELLFRKHGGNLREALREWYELLALGQAS